MTDAPNMTLDMTLDEARDLLWKFVLERDPIVAHAARRVLDAQLLAFNQRDALLALAAAFQDDYTRKLSVVAAFRRWRNGSHTTEQFLESLRSDDHAPVLHYEPVMPMDGLQVLNAYREGEERKSRKIRKP